jgi:hypothetical protein
LRPTRSPNEERGPVQRTLDAEVVPAIHATPLVAP